MSGTVGTSSGTDPSASPTTSPSSTSRVAASSPSHSTARVASTTSARPASGRPRIVARVSASRTASITCALETGRSCSRSSAATWVIHRVTTWSGAVNRWWYQPGEVMPAP